MAFVGVPRRVRCASVMLPDLSVSQTTQYRNSYLSIFKVIHWTSR